MPVSFRNTYAETTPPVAKPRSRSICGRSRSLGFDEADIVPHAGLERQTSGQDRGVRRQGLRRVRIRALEDDAVGRERVDRRRLHVACSRTPADDRPAACRSKSG